MIKELFKEKPKTYLKMRGGKKILHKLIPILYENVLNDETLKLYFKGLDMELQINKFIQLCKCILKTRNLSQIQRNCTNLKAVHKEMNLSGKDFELFLMYFKKSLK